MENDMRPQPEEQAFPYHEIDTADDEPDIVQATSRHELSAIKSDDVQLVIWQRKLPDTLQTWLENLDEQVMPVLRVLLEPAELRPAMETLLHGYGLPKGEMRDLLIEDINDLVAAFADITQSELVDVRLEYLNHDACWKFHRDSVEARLLTTYFGQATEWVPTEFAEQALHEQKEFQGPLERLDAHDVAFFKGSSASPNSGIVHRSPPIAGTGHSRLLLCVNEPFATDLDP